jgi:hypothetical protein
VGSRLHQGLNGQPLGDEPLNRVRQAERVAAGFAAQRQRIEREVVGTREQSARVTAAGDARRLRGVPCAGRGISGHIAGTDPVEALMDKYELEAWA